MNQLKEAFQETTPPSVNRMVKSSDATARLLRCFCPVAMASAQPAYASMFQGETLDQVADIVAWVALIVAPLTVIIVFWLIHILPEKIAEKRKHPQAKAIQTVCLLSLFFGGMLWPIAWVWAYTKPVLHKMAYGTDVHDEDEHAAAAEDASELDRVRMKRTAERDGVSREPISTRERA
jgi:CBS domain containing-hemolysin-like protein